MTAGAVLLAPGAGLAEGPAGAIDAVVRAYHDAGQLQGVVLVERGGEVLYRQGFGVADEAWCTPNRPETRFQIGSITKQLSAALVARLAEEGRVDLDAPVRRYLPDLTATVGDGVTLHRLLTHTAGIADPGPEETMALLAGPLPAAEIVGRFCSGSALEPGTGFAYSNCGYLLAGAVVETIVGQPVREALEGFLADVGLAETGFTDRGAPLPRLAEGYLFHAGRWGTMPTINWSNAVASGSLYSTVDDLLRWRRALAAGEVLGPAMLERSLTPVGPGYAYGTWVGWGSAGQIDALLAERDEPVEPEARQLRLAVHGGGLPGFQSILVQRLDEPATVAVLDNHQIAGAAEHRRLAHLAADLVRLLVGEQPQGPQPAYGPAEFPPDALDALPACPGVR